MPDIFVPQDTIGMTSYFRMADRQGADHPFRLRLYRQKPECPQGIRYGRETGKLSENPEPAEHFCQLGGKERTEAPQQPDPAVEETLRNQPVWKHHLQHVRAGIIYRISEPDRPDCTESPGSSGRRQVIPGSSGTAGHRKERKT